MCVCVYISFSVGLVLQHTCGTCLQLVIYNLNSEENSFISIEQVLAADLKQTLLPGMRNMLQDHGKKLCTIQAWGWYIRLLGSNAVKNRHLVNEMLKILEQTFSDSVPQVQIASVVFPTAIIFCGFCLISLAMLACFVMHAYD